MKSFKTNIFSILFFLLATHLALGQTGHQCDFTCSPHRFAARFYASPLMTKLNSDTYSSEAKSRLGFNIGADLAYYFVNNGKFKSSISLGLGLTKYNSRYKLAYADSAWETDVDNEQVFIRENLNKLSEDQGILFLDIPVKLGFEYSLSPRLDVYLNLGVTYGLAIQDKYENSALLTRTGYYPAYNALLYDIDVAGSAYFYPTDKAISGSGEFNKLNNLSLEAALGLKYKLNFKWSVFGGLKFMHGFNAIKDGQGMMSQMSSDYVLNSVMNRGDKVTTQAVGAEIGLAMNLGKCKKAGEEIVEPLAKNVVVEYIVTDSATNKPVKADVDIKENGQTAQKVSCDDNGIAKANLVAGKVYTAEITANEYVSKNETTNLNGVESGIKKSIILSPVPKPIVVKPDTATIVVQPETQELVKLYTVDSKSGKPVKATIEVKQNDQIIQTIQTDDNGQALVVVPKGKDYIVIASAEGYVYQYQTVDLEAVSKSPKKEFQLTPMEKVKKGKKMELYPVNFESGLENIDSTDVETLNLVLLMLKDNTGMQIEVSGHADSVGESDANMQLSLKRAQTIIDFLVSKGANSKQLVPLACGSTRPIADNATEEGRSKNRRVEFKVIKY
jgi:outer membrane protein OmpA-like peptidoglycan-associated protein